MKKPSVKVSHKDLERNARDALDVLMRARVDGSDTACGHDGPVNIHVAIGYARACLRIGLRMPPKEIKHGS
jgi:L-asparaginase II